MPTWADAKLRVQTELDLADEDFVSADELLEYGNAALNRAESKILDLSEDYFLDEPATVALVDGQASYSLPSGIYAQKIRSLIYDNGSKKYKVKRIKRLEDTEDIVAGDNYQYLVTNSVSNGTKLRLYPTPSEAGNLMTLWFLRNCNPIVDDDTEIDLPEAYDYFIQFIKDCCINKERLSPDAPPSAALKEAEMVMLSALHQRFPDEQNLDNEELIEYIEEVGC